MDRSQCRRLTLGVEEEFQLLCPETLALVPGFDTLAACWRAETAADRRTCAPLHAARMDAGHRLPTQYSRANCIKAVVRLSPSRVRPFRSWIVSFDPTGIASPKSLEDAGMAIGLSGTHPFSALV